MARRYGLGYTTPFGETYTANRDSPQSVGLVGWWPVPGRYGGRLASLGSAPLSADPGTAPPLEADPLMGASLLFDGSTSSRHLLVAPHSAINDLPPGGMTASVWVRWGATTNNQSPFGKSAAAGNGWWLRHASGSVMNATVVYSGGAVSISETTAHSVGDLVHYVLTFDPTDLKVRIYTDGVLRNTSSAASGTYTVETTQALALGRLGGNFWYWIGKAADWRLYNRVLSPAEIWQIYDPQTRWDLYRPTKWRTIVVADAGGPEDITGTGGVTIGAPALAGSGTYTPEAVTGTGGVAIGAPALAGSGTYTPEAITGTGAVQIGAPSLAGSGTYTPEAIAGTGAVTIGVPTLAGTGTYTPQAITGDGAIQIGAPALAGSGDAAAPGEITGSGGVVIGAPVLAGSGAYTPEAVTGSGAVQIGPPILAASGTYTPEAITGTGAIQIGVPALAGSGTADVPSFEGTGALLIGAPSLAGSGAFTPNAITGTGELTIGPPSLYGIQVFVTATASAAVSLYQRASAFMSRG